MADTSIYSFESWIRSLIGEVYPQDVVYFDCKKRTEGEGFRWVLLDENEEELHAEICATEEHAFSGAVRYLQDKLAEQEGNTP